MVFTCGVRQGHAQGMLIRTRAEAIAIGAASTHAATILYYNVSNSAWSMSPLSYTLHERTEFGTEEHRCFGTYILEICSMIS